MCAILAGICYFICGVPDVCCIVKRKCISSVVYEIVKKDFVVAGRVVEAYAIPVVTDNIARNLIVVGREVEAYAIPVVADSIACNLIVAGRG